MTRAAGRSPSSQSSPGSDTSAQLGPVALDIHVAARTKVPVLISAPPECAVNIARAIAAFAGAWKASDVVVCDCAGGDNLEAAVAGAQSLAAAIRQGDPAAPGGARARTQPSKRRSRASSPHW